MNSNFISALRRATDLVRGHKLAEATGLIQTALAAGANRTEDSARPAAQEQVLSARLAPRDGRLARFARLKGPRKSVADVARTAPVFAGGLNPVVLPGAPMPLGASFLARCFACAAGTRSYKLYVPACPPDAVRGLVIMLHGCKQNPDDFAAGTNMNAVAQASGLLVAYPGQASAANASACWNWFSPADQVRNSGEPSILAGLALEIMQEFAIDHRRVFVAGLSAGGAMAAILGETYPELFSAVGVHSGLPCGSAHDVVSAFSAMQGAGKYRSASKRGTRGTRTIVFHGSADRTVHPANADLIVAAANPCNLPAANVDRGHVNGRNYSRTQINDANGRQMVENWLVEGAGHAWSGGKPGGSFTDQRGPDASALMVRFFLEAPSLDA